MTEPEMRKVRVRIPATTANCGPGFDTLGIACSLYNHVELHHDPLGSGIDISVCGDGADTVPKDTRNLVLRSVQAVFEAAGKPLGRLQLCLDNEIPLSRGLGSSSAAIVGGLTAANAVLGNVFSQDKLLDMATAIEGHPDNVAPAIYGGFTISAVQGKAVVCMRLPVPNALKLIVCVPDFRLSTHKSRQALPAHVTMKDAVFNVSRATLLVGAIVTGQLNHLCAALEDRLHQPYRASLITGMQDVFDAAAKAGALGTTISGAGPSLMAYATDKADEIGQAMVKAFDAHHIKSRYIKLDVDTAGAQIVA